MCDMSKFFGQIRYNFKAGEDFCELGTEYLNTPLCKFCAFSRQNFKTFDLSHASLPLPSLNYQRSK